MTHELGPRVQREADEDIGDVLEQLHTVARVPVYVGVDEA